MPKLNDPNVNESVIQALIQHLAKEEPVAMSLGTPFLADSETTDALVAIGSPAVPFLIEALKSDNGRIVMYAAYTLGLIGDSRAVPGLVRLRDIYLEEGTQHAESSGILSAANTALERLSDCHTSEE